MVEKKKDETMDNQQPSSCTERLEKVQRLRRTAYGNRRERFVTVPELYGYEVCRGRGALEVPDNQT